MSQTTVNPFVKPTRRPGPPPEEIHHIVCGCTEGDKPRRAMCGFDLTRAVENKSPTDKTPVCVVCREFDATRCPKCKQ